MVSLVRAKVHIPGWAPAYVLLLTTTSVLALLFLGEPLLGDDLTYWGTATALHEIGLTAWNGKSFYDLRWPVWGACWFLQTLGFSGLPSFWGTPIIYSAAGVTLAFVLARRLTSNSIFAFASGLAFFFHPFLDPISSAPMPDLSEAVWGAAAMLAWWKTMHASTWRARWLGSIALGFGVFVLEANRVTGLFLVPVLIIGTACLFRTRFRWLLAAGLIALLFYAAECFFYHRLFGDWLHDLTVNASNRGAKGTELTQPWLLPFRFLDSFWHEPLMRYYSLGALAGAVLAWRRAGPFGRVLVLWSGLLLLAFSCTPQSLHPLRPLLRDAPRFLASLAAPMSILAVFALQELAQVLRSSQRTAPILRRRIIPIGSVAALFFLFLAMTRREFLSHGFIPQARRYLASVPNGATIFTHHSLYQAARLISPKDAARLRWRVHSEILEVDPAREEDAKSADEFWYAHKLTWLRTSQRLNKQPDGPPPQLATYFSEPEKSWKLAEVIVQGNKPELVFYRRRSNGDADPSSSRWSDLLPVLPLTWERGRAPSRLKANWPLPPELGGRLVRLRMAASADDVDAVTVRLRFLRGKVVEKPLDLQPLLTRESGPAFFALRVPKESTACQIQLRFSDRAQRVTLTRLEALSEAPSAP